MVIFRSYVSLPEAMCHYIYYELKTCSGAIISGGLRYLIICLTYLGLDICLIYDHICGFVWFQKSAAHCNTSLSLSHRLGGMKSQRKPVGEQCWGIAGHYVFNRSRKRVFNSQLIGVFNCSSYVGMELSCNVSIAGSRDKWRKILWRNFRDLFSYLSAICTEHMCWCRFIYLHISLSLAIYLIHHNDYAS